jgi:hypothetical protein
MVLASRINLDPSAPQSCGENKSPHTNTNPNHFFMPHLN